MAVKGYGNRFQHSVILVFVAHDTVAYRMILHLEQPTHMFECAAVQNKKCDNIR